MIRADELYQYMTKEAKSKTMCDIEQADKSGMDIFMEDDGLIPRDVQIRRASEKAAERQLENIEMRISGISDVLEATSRTLDLTEIMKIVNDSSAGEDIVNVVICGVKRKINFHACLQNSAFRLQFAKLCVREVS